MVQNEFYPQPGYKIGTEKRKLWERRTVNILNIKIAKLLRRDSDFYLLRQEKEDGVI